MKRVEMNIPALRFPGFEGEWELKKLGEVAVSISSGKSKIKDSIGDYPLYGSTGIIGKLDSYEYSGKNILIARVGANAGTLYKVDGNYSVTDNTLILKLINLVCLDFLFFYLVKENLNKLVFGSGQPLITGGQLKELNIHLPTLPEQNKIASFLSAVDEKLQQLKQEKAYLVQYKKGVMQRIFNYELRFTNDDGSAFPDWEEKSLGEVFTEVSRPIIKPEGNYKSIGIRSHFKGTFQRLDVDPLKTDMETLFQVKENDLIVNITFAWEGAVAIVSKDDENGLVSHRFPTYENNKDLILIDFFRFVYPTKEFKYSLDLISPGGAGRNRVLKKSDFLKIKFNLPTLAEQIKIANLLSAIDEKITNITNQITLTEQWKKGLLQGMFV